MLIKWCHKPKGYLHYSYGTIFGNILLVFAAARFKNEKRLNKAGTLSWLIDYKKELEKSTALIIHPYCHSAGPKPISDVNFNVGQYLTFLLTNTYNQHDSATVLSLVKVIGSKTYASSYVYRAC